MKIDHIPDQDDLKEVFERIKPYIHRTPVLTSSTFNKWTNNRLFFKCENFQKMGAFKMRGACNAVFSMSETDCRLGVATHSSGNFAQALALAARYKNIPAYIVMPSNAPQIKRQAVVGYGATVIECAPNLLAREETLQKVILETGAYFVHPYNDYDVIAGQASCAMELLDEVPDLQIVVAPVGGGGLISGTALAVKYIAKNCLVIAAEPLQANDAFLSKQKGEIVAQTNPQTIADGLRTSLGDKTFPIINELVNEIVLVSEDEIKQSLRLLMERMKVVVEPSAAVAFAAVLKNKSWRGKNIGIILSGGNIDLLGFDFI